MELVFKRFFEVAPKDVLRLIAGGAILGVVLLMFLKVADTRFALSPRQLDTLGLGATPVLGLMLCIDIVPLRKRALHLFAASLVIFAVGFASNQVVAELKGIWVTTSAAPPAATPPAIPKLEEIETRGDER